MLVAIVRTGGSEDKVLNRYPTENEPIFGRFVDVKGVIHSIKSVDKLVIAGLLVAVRVNV